MTRLEFDTLRIKPHCRQPNLLECSERQTSYAQSGDEICLRCPVASWVTALVLNGAGMDAEADWFEGDSLKRTEKILVPVLAAKAA